MKIILILLLFGSFSGIISMLVARYFIRVYLGPENKNREITKYGWTGILLFSFVNVYLNQLELHSIFEKAVGIGFGVLLLTIAYIDLKIRKVPNVFSLISAVGIAITRGIIHPNGRWWEYPLGALLAAIIFIVLIMLSKGGIGGGDLKLYIVCGWFLGYNLIIPSILLTSVIGALWAVASIVINKGNKHVQIPYVPSIALSVMLIYFFY